VYQPDRLHDVRIAAKKLRYAVEVASDATGKRMAADLRLLRRVQETLGHLHDRHVLVERVRQVRAGLAVPELAVWRQLDVLVIGLENECRRLHARYMRDREALATLVSRMSDSPLRKSESAAMHRSTTSRRVR